MKILLIILLLPIVSLSFGQNNSRILKNINSNLTQAKNSDIIEIYKFNEEVDKNKKKINDSVIYSNNGTAVMRNYRVVKHDKNYYYMPVGIWRDFYKNGKVSDSGFYTNNSFCYKLIHYYKNGKVSSILLSDSITTKMIGDFMDYGNSSLTKNNKRGELVYIELYTKSNKSMEKICYNKEGDIRKRKIKIKK